ncbi:MAG: ABC transporter permease [Erysipelothrix sp.]|nr:ABC transporter permease [Erysipelothrix sp.]
MKKKNYWLSKIWIGLTLLFLYIPIVTMMVFSFNEKRSLSVWGGFSLKWYSKLWQGRKVMEAVVNTFSIAIIATIVAVIIGTITAIGLSKSRKIIRNIVLNISDLPMLNPEIVTAIGLMLLFTTMGLPKGFVTVLLAHIIFCVPYVILAILPKLRSLDENLVEAAMDLGATPTQALFKVILPQLKSSIIAGALIAFTMSFDDYIISYFVTGNGFRNVSILVSTMGRRTNPSVNALSTIFVLVIFVGLVLYNIAMVVSKKKGANKYEKIK